MSDHVKGWALIGVMTALFAGPALAADDVSVLKDLTSVIALNALPCGQVVSAARQGNDYIASCKDGSRYLVSVNSQGRVVVEKQ